MCLKAPKMPPMAQTPQRDRNATLAQDNRRRMSEQQGVYGNIFTSALGDTGYGANVAKYGRAA